MPLVVLRVRPATLELRSGVMHHGARSAAGTLSRTLLASDARLLLGGAGPLRVVGEGRLLRGSDGNYPYLGAEAEMAVARGTVYGFAGRWLSDEIPSVPWGVGAGVRVGGRTELRASLQQDATDPLFWGVPRRSWSIGVSRRLGSTAALPPAVLPARAAGGVTLRIPRSASPATPSVAGDFSGWKPVSMREAGDEWIVSLQLPSGVHRYAFRRPDGTWFVPPGTPGLTDDGMGGVAAVLVVP
jgi:hypothetical protein